METIDIKKIDTKKLKKVKLSDKALKNLSNAISRLYGKNFKVKGLKYTKKIDKKGEVVKYDVFTESELVNDDA